MKISMRPISAFLRSVLDRLRLAAFAQTGLNSLTGSRIFPAEPARSEPARGKSPRHSSNAMETRRDRAFHLPFRSQLCRDTGLGGSRVSLSRRGEGTGARPTADRHQIAHLHFRAPGGMAAVSRVWANWKNGPAASIPRAVCSFSAIRNKNFPGICSGTRSSIWCCTAFIPTAFPAGWMKGSRNTSRKGARQL